MTSSNPSYKDFARSSLRVSCFKTSQNIIEKNCTNTLQNNYSLNSLQTLKNYFDEREGLCAGFSLLWLICMMNSYSKKTWIENEFNIYSKFSKYYNLKIDRELIKEINKIDIKWFYNTVGAFIKDSKYTSVSFKRFSDKFFNDELTDYFKKRHRNFISHVKQLHSISNLLFTTKKTIIIEYNYNKIDFNLFLDEVLKTKKDHLCCNFSTSNHEMAIYVQKHESFFKFSFYDPNTTNGQFDFTIRYNNDWRHITQNTINKAIAMSGYFTQPCHEARFIILQLFSKSDFLLHTFDDLISNKTFCNDIYCNLTEPVKISSAINLLIQSNDIISIHNLIKKIKNIDINQEGIDHEIPLFYAAKQGKDEIIKMFLNISNINPNIGDKNNATPLLISSQLNKINSVKMLLNNPKTDPNICTTFGSSPLYVASFQGHTEIVKLLLKHPKIKIDTLHSNGKTPLSIAEEKGFKEIQELLKAQISKNTKPLIYEIPVLKKIFIKLEEHLKKYNNSNDLNILINWKTITNQDLSKFSRKKLGLEILKLSKEQNTLLESLKERCLKVLFALYYKRFRPNLSDIGRVFSLAPFIDTGFYPIKNSEITSQELIAKSHKFLLSNKNPNHLSEHIFLILSTTMNIKNK